MGWSVRRSVFPYKVGHSDVPSTRAVGGLGQIRSGFAANWSMGLSRARGAWTASGRVSLPGTPSPPAYPGTIWLPRLGATLAWPTGQWAFLAHEGPGRP